LSGMTKFWRSPAGCATSWMAWSISYIYKWGRWRNMYPFVVENESIGEAP
jgi:hypothetical protein